jgi:curli biogenesis system outer membrane secretion channel CsgG
MPVSVTLRAALVVAVGATLGGCASMTDTRTPAVEVYDEVRTAPILPITRTVTGFNEGLRCMDGQLATYGVGASLIVEDLNDRTQKVPAGTTDMFISAMSQMTRRSQAIRTVAFSDDTKNLTTFMTRAGSKEAFQLENIPTYAIRGSITQFDDNLAKKTVDGGVTLGIGQKSFLGVGASKSSSINMVALDLAAVRAKDFSLVAGVNSRNSAAILQEGWGVDGEASYKKLGVNFMTSLSKSDGKTIALRNLVELSAIELMGKLNKVPYWKCLGVTSNQLEVAAEIEDWHQAMGAGEKVAFYLRHFRAMGLVPDDGAPVPGYMIKEALRSYFKALNLPYDGKFSLKLMRAHFDANQDQILPTAIAAMEEERRLRLEIKVKLANTPIPNGVDRGQAKFNIFNNTDSFVYCFLQDEKKAVVRVFPNPWQSQALIPALQTLALPRAGTFNVMSHPKIAQSLSCYTTREDVTARLPALLTGQGLSAIRGVNEIAGITAQFAALGEEFRESNIEFKGADAAVFAKAPAQMAKK